MDAELRAEVVRWFARLAERGVNMASKLLAEEDFSLSEVDGLIEAAGKYQAYLICLRKHAKA